MLEIEDLDLDLDFDTPVKEKPEIIIKDGRLIEITDEMTRVIMADGSPFFYLNSQMVTVTEDVLGVNIRPTTEIDIQDFLMRNAVFLKVINEQLVSTDLNPKYARHLLKRYGTAKNPPARPLKKIIEGPTINLANNTLISTHGYDPDSQLFFDNTANLEYPKDFPELTEAAAREALDKLKFLTDEFNFTDEVDQSVAIAALMTPQIRALLPTAPGFAITSPDVGKGKSFLLDTACIYATGHRVPVVNFTGNKDEDNRSMFSQLFYGRSIIAIDNVDCEFNTAAFSSLLTQEQYTARVIGTSKTPKVSTNITLFINGVNLHVNKDIARRILPISLKATDKKFNRDACKYAAENRVDLNMAGLTLMAAHQAAGFPGTEGLSTFSSYDDWSKWVRAALVWLGMPDPCDRLKWWSQYNHDDNVLTMLLHQLYNFFGPEKTFTVSNLCAEFLKHGNELDALGTIASSGGKNLNRRVLGKWLSAKLGTIRDGLFLENVGVYQGAQKYRVVANENYQKSSIKS